MRRSAETGECGEAVLEFIKAIDAYKRANHQPTVLFTEVFELMLFLGYRKVADPAESIHDIPDPDDPARVSMRDAGPFCYDCGGSITPSKYHRCDSCRLRFIRETKEKNRKMTADWMAKRQAEGLCVYCGEVNNDERFKVCWECRQKYRGKNNSQIEAWKSAGLCSRCGNEKPAPGRKTCDTCLAKKAKYRSSQNPGQQAQVLRRA